MVDQSEHIFVKSTDSQYVDAIFSILRKCGYNMARKGLFHWIPSYPRRSIRKDCQNNWVVLVYDKTLNAFTSTFQMVKKSESEMYFRKLATSPEFDGRGIGKANLAYMESFAQKQGCSKALLDVYVKSVHAISLYRRLGYQVIGTKRSVRFKELIMEKSI